jgi:hypothetical protein
LLRRDDRFFSPAWRVLVHNHQLVGFGRAQASITLKNIIHLREKLVILEPQVAVGQRFECQKSQKEKWI